MNIEITVAKELEDGSAICELTLDNEAKEYFIGEGFLAVIKRALETSESYVKPELLEENKDVEL
jgi:hypothetical protein